MKNFSNKLVLITGGGMGMGKGMAKKFLELGAKVIILDINQEVIDDVIDEFSDFGYIKGFVCDVSSLSAIKKVKKEIEKSDGKIDILINNAGVVSGGNFHELTEKEIKKTIDVDLYGVVWMTKVFINDLIGKDDAVIVNIASAAGLLGVPQLVPYCASKFAVVGFSESLRFEMQSLNFNVHVMAVCPSYVGTGMFDGAKPPKFTKMIHPDTMVKLIVEGIEKEKTCLIVPLLSETVPILKAVLPESALKRINDLFGITNSMSQWKGRGKIK